MADHIKNAIVTAFVVWVSVTTGINIGWIATSFDVAAAVYLAFATTLVGGVVAGMTSKGINATSGNFGSKFAARSSTAHRQLIYGKCRVGGTIVHMETTGVDNYLLHVVVVLSGHEIQSLESVRLNDVDLTTDSPSTISGSSVYTVTNADFTNSENENKFNNTGNLIRYTFEDGSQTTRNLWMDAQLSSITESDKFLDCAYVYMQMVFDPEKFGGGMPNMSFVVKGKKVYDPRTDSTAWSENPALCVRDYLSNTTYGLKALSSEINDTTNAGGIAAAANACEVEVYLADNSTKEDKYTANGFTNFGANGQGVLEGLLSAMAGKLSYTNGQFNVFAGTTQTPSLTITDDNLLAPVNVTTNTATGELYNTVKPIFVDASNNYVATDAPAYQDSTFLTEDTPNGVTNDKPNYVKQVEKQLPFTTTHTMAQRIGRLALKDQRMNTTLSCLVDLSFMRLQPADWVYVTNERLGYSQKIFEVGAINMEVMQDEDVPILGVRLSLKETASSIYAFATSDYAAAIAQGSDLALGSYAMAAPSSLAVTTDTLDVDAFNMTSVTITWTNSASPLVTGTEIEYKKNSSSTWLGFNTVGKGVASANIAGGMEMGIQYNFRIRHVGAIGTFSAWTSTYNHTVGGTAVATSAITNSTVNYGSDGTGTLPAGSGGTGITNFANSTHLNSNTTKNDVGLGSVDNDSTATIREGTTAANVGLGNVPNVDMRDLSNANAGTLAVARGGTGLTSVSTLLNSNVDAEHVGLENVPNVDMRNLSNATTGTVAKARGGFGEDVSSKTGALSVSSGTFTFGTLPASKGGTGLTSTSTLLNSNVTTFTVDKAQVVFWSNLADNLTPAATTFDWTITWLNGAGTSLGTTVIRAAVNTSNNTSLLAMNTQSNGASATVSLGGAVSAGSFQVTTVTKNSIVCSLSAQIIDGSGWDFKSG